MESIVEIVRNFEPIIIMALISTVVILFFVAIIQGRSLSKLEKKYRRFMRGVDNKNIEELINLYLDKVDKSFEKTEYIKELYKSIDERLNTCIQKVSIIRYRAFADVGSDLSYSIALLDSKNSGVIITGIYARSESTTYAKPIDKGISRYELSDEEKHVLKEAINKSV